MNKFLNKFLKTTLLTLCAAALFSASALAESSSALLPVRATLEREGYTVTWDQDSLSVTISKGDFTLTEKIGDTIILYRDTAYAPEEFFNELYAGGVQDKQTEPVIYTYATITEVGDNYILAENEIYGEIKFIVNDETDIHHEKNKMLYRLDALEAGMNIKVHNSDAMTLSIPPQTYAYEVIVLN